jgi:hypothetical protein
MAADRANPSFNLRVPSRGSERRARKLGGTVGGGRAREGNTCPVVERSAELGNRTRIDPSPWPCTEGIAPRLSLVGGGSGLGRVRRCGLG